MDWITFIKWNGIVYGTYYGANLLVDYMRISKGSTVAPAITEYKIEDANMEKPQTIRSQDYQYVQKDKEPKAEKAGTPKSPEAGNIRFNAPIERQGIPLKEFLRTAHQYATQIYQPTI
jgi:hypothetical protein